MREARLFTKISVMFPPFQCRVHYWDGLGVDRAKALWHYDKGAGG